jgi:hypothetical protein
MEYKSHSSFSRNRVVDFWWLGGKRSHFQAWNLLNFLSWNLGNLYHIVGSKNPSIKWITAQPKNIIQKVIQYIVIPANLFASHWKFLITAKDKNLLNSNGWHKNNKNCLWWLSGVKFIGMKQDTRNNQRIFSFHFSNFILFFR